MNKMLIIFTIAFISCSNISSDQSIGPQNYNVVENDTSLYLTGDSTRLKNGLVKEEDGLKEVYYINGKKNGIFKSYYKLNGKLEAIGFYENNNAVGTWYYFDEKSQILMIEDKKGLNRDKQVKNEDGVSVRPKYESYLKLYNPQTGLLKNEGIALYDEDIEIDYFKYGTWKSH